MIHAHEIANRYSEDPTFALTFQKAPEVGRGIDVTVSLTTGGDLRGIRRADYRIYEAVDGRLYVNRGGQYHREYFTEDAAKIVRSFRDRESQKREKATR